MFELNLQPGKLCLATLRRVSREPVHVSLDPAALAGIHASAAVVTTRPGGTGIPKRANNSLAWYSWIFIGAPRSGGPRS